MAPRNVFALNPVDAELAYQSGELQRPKVAAPETKAPKAPNLTESGDPDFAALATTHQVPRNVLIALTDMAGLNDPAQKGGVRDRSGPAHWLRNQDRQGRLCRAGLGARGRGAGR